ncbi:uncharacterized protein TNCV_2826431 [Trichonephila clavipes]|nr:uncharacterized protein TNCV_2826431 [Trichonephila clavipes]
MFAQHKDDKKRVEKALEACNFPSGKNDTIPSEKFSSEVFFNFYRNLAGRDEVDKIFEKLSRHGQQSSYNNTVLPHLPVDTQFEIPYFSENMYGNNIFDQIKIIQTRILLRQRPKRNEASADGQARVLMP